MICQCCNCWFKKFLMCSWMLVLFSDQVRNDNDLNSPTIKIKYTNQFKFLLKSGDYLGFVKDNAVGLGFVYKIPIVAEFYLFIRDDVHRYSDSPYDKGKLQAAQRTLSSYVISIVQDYERIWNDTLFDQFYGQFEDEPSKSEWDTAVGPLVQSSGSLGSSEPNCDTRDVFVAFIDIGFELDHPNLINSTGVLLSHDFFLGTSDVKPDIYSSDVKGEWGQQIYDMLSHGTSCMGRVGATVGNGCDRGVAPNVTLVGLKAIHIGRSMTDTTESLALSYKRELIDVFSCSYGIQDNIGFREPSEATKAALMKGATKGHGCRGVLYIFPSGNGHHDNCNADGYAHSIYTITIAEVQRNGQLPEYTEVCPAAIAATQGNGYSTTKLNGRCSSSFGGSSASCAVAAGFAGQLRFYRPCLSKRDIEHIMVRTARTNENITWKTNGVGRKYNHQIGFGELDLDRMLETAETWKYVPEVHTCALQPIDKGPKHVTGSNWISKSVVVSDGCRNQPNHVKYLEYVQVEMDLRCSNIFHVAIRLTSPLGTVSNILTSINISRNISNSFKTLRWNFTSVHFWGESSNGPWTIEVMVENSSVEVDCKYTVTKLVLHGTDTDPEKGGDPLRCKESPVTSDGTEKSSLSATAIFFIIVAPLLCIGVVIISICYIKKKRQAHDTAQNNGYVARYNNVPNGSEINTGINFEPESADPLSTDS